MTRYTIDADGLLHLPDGLSVGGGLDLSCTAITALPDGLSVGGSLNLRGTAITALPDGLSVGGYLNLSDTAITALPDDIMLGGCRISDAPVIPDIHRAVYEAASRPGALDMSDWHCGTAHCRAGWVVTLAGEAGRALEARIGTANAACLIYAASDPSRPVPDFYCDDATALADMKRMAEAVCRPFQPSWRLDPPDALAVVIRIALHRRGVVWGDALATDEQWHEMCAEIIAMMAHGISPMALVEMPRLWDKQ